VLLNALSGPTLGVAAYQWALRTTPSGIVLPIVATSPLLVIPFTYWFEGDRPGGRSLAGAAVAVAGVIGLTLVR
jgi:drug/metabolite transporter (DMT)-like permease